jgi:hypothetical protein
MEEEYSSYDSKGLFITSSLIVLAGLSYLIFLNVSSDLVMIPVGFAAMLAGMFLEVGRVTKNWQSVWVIVMVSCLSSMFLFMPNRNNEVDFLEKLPYWPLMFSFFFTIICVVWFENKFVPQIDEGFTLIQSVSIVYWCLEIGVHQWDWLSVKLAFFLPLGLLVGTAVFHAFTYFELSKGKRLILSIWSSIIMLAFSADNIIGALIATYNGPPPNIDLVYFLRYFFLGIALTYIMQNFMLLQQFFPGKNDKKGEYAERVKQLKELHSSRFSPHQVKRSHATLGLLFAGTIYGLNLQFDIVPRQIAIWSVFVTFPMVLAFFIRYVEGNLMRR